jgi:hypothetical protein
VQPARGDAELHVDGEQVDHAPEPEELLDDLVRYVDLHTSRDAPQLLMHGGAVELDGVAVVLPGSSGAGKSTLTAGLVSAGFRYLSDEIVAVARDTRRLEPYPRPLMLRAPSAGLLPEARRVGVRIGEGTTAERWLVPPAALGAVGQPCAIACIAFPRFESGAPTRLEPISRAEALYELCGQTLQFDRDSRAALDLLETIVRDADCYRLVMGDLDSAVALIVELAHRRSA